MEELTENSKTSITRDRMTIQIHWMNRHYVICLYCTHSLG